MGIFPLHFKLAVAGVPDRGQSALAALLLQKDLQLFFRVHRDQYHAAAQASQTDPFPGLSPQIFENRHGSYLGRQCLVCPYKGQLVLLDIVAQDQKPQLFPKRLMLRLHDPSDALHLSPALDQDFLHGIPVGEGDFLPVHTARLFQLLQELLPLPFRHFVGLRIVIQEPLQQSVQPFGSQLWQLSLCADQLPQIGGKGDILSLAEDQKG